MKSSVNGLGNHRSYPGEEIFAFEGISIDGCGFSHEYLPDDVKEDLGFGAKKSGFVAIDELPGNALDPADIFLAKHDAAVMTDEYREEEVSADAAELESDAYGEFPPPVTDITIDGFPLDIYLALYPVDEEAPSMVGHLTIDEYAKLATIVKVPAAACEESGVAEIITTGRCQHSADLDKMLRGDRFFSRLLHQRILRPIGVSRGTVKYKGRPPEHQPRYKNKHKQSLRDVTLLQTDDAPSQRSASRLSPLEQLMAESRLAALVCERLYGRHLKVTSTGIRKTVIISYAMLKAVD